jgi:DNA-binding FadR family transcriptional regulator
MKGRRRLSDQIADQLESMIAEGSFKPGERLPAERQLAETLEVSRPSLREAIQKLSSKGLIDTRPGGGSYVTEGLDPSFVNPLINILKEQPESRFDVLEIRHALEGTAAYYAALRATDEDRENICKRFETMINTHGAADPMEEAQADAEFHLSISEAAHNIVLLHVMRGLFALLKMSVEHNLDKLYTLPQIFQPLSRQHENIMRAVVEGDPDRARTAAQDHLVFVEESLQRIDQQEARKARSLRRLSSLVK